MQYNMFFCDKIEYLCPIPTYEICYFNIDTVEYNITELMYYLILYIIDW